MSTRGGRFTLIEMMAVVAIFALLAAFVVADLPAPQLARCRTSRAGWPAQLEFARQRAVMTGIPHRVWPRPRPLGATRSSGSCAVEAAPDDGKSDAPAPVPDLRERR